MIVELRLLCGTPPPQDCILRSELCSEVTYILQNDSTNLSIGIFCKYILYTIDIIFVLLDASLLITYFSVSNFNLRR